MGCGGLDIPVPVLTFYRETIRGVHTYTPYLPPSRMENKFRVSISLGLSMNRLDGLVLMVCSVRKSVRFDPSVCLHGDMSERVEFIQTYP